MRSTTSRRTLLALLGSIGLTGLAGSASAAGRSGHPPGWCDARSDDRSTASTDALARSSDDYVAVVDRVVDGRFVVLLLEDDGRLVDERVVPWEELSAEEGDVFLVSLDGEKGEEYRHLVGETRRRRRSNERRLGCLSASER
ncbi:DUF3006 family protein [Natronorarus salvus]|uniref:DUF3006 family protein n=1 Tax=Natronorarus salvus TaxID=3117733 RepID=UPI002F267541